MKEFTSVAELQAHYREVRSRRPPMEQPRPAVVTPDPPPPEPPPKPVAVLPPAVPIAVFPFKRIARIVCDYYGVEWCLVTVSIREPRLVRPRQIFCYICNQCAKQSLPRIGRAVERDHTTVLHGIRKISALVEAGDPEVMHAVETITARFKEGT